MFVVRRVPTFSSYLSRISINSFRWKSKRSDKNSADFNSELLNFDRKSSAPSRNPTQNSIPIAQPLDANTRKQKRNEEQKKSRPQVILDTDLSEVKVLTRQVADSLTPKNAPTERNHIEEELLEVLRGHRVVSKTTRRTPEKSTAPPPTEQKNSSKQQKATPTTDSRKIEKTTEAFSSLLRDIKLKPARSSTDSPVEKDALPKDERTGPSRLSDERETRRPPRDNRRRQEYLKPHRLYSGDSLGIFTDEDFQNKKGEEGSPIWNKFEEEELKRLSAIPPRNAFEEMIQWTNEGILWKFPINNEQDVGAEADVPFYDHVLLERHLQDFPNSPLIRQFMELVCIGLGRNPYWTAEQKLEHINWFRKYFNEKIEILNETVHTGALKSAPTVSTKPVSTFKPKQTATPPPSAAAPAVSPAASKK